MDWKTSWQRKHRIPREVRFHQFEQERVTSKDQLTLSFCRFFEVAEEVRGEIVRGVEEDLVLVQDECLSMDVKIGTGIGTIPVGFLTDSIAVGRWPVRGSAWADRRTRGPGSDSEEGKGK